MKRNYLLSFVFLVLVLNSCCKVWSSKNTEKCNCKEFENYIKTWKIDIETGVFYVDIDAKNNEKQVELQEIFTDRLDCLKGKSIGEVKKIFHTKQTEKEAIIPKSKECATCFIGREECEYIFRDKIICSYFKIEFGQNNDEIIKGVSESLQPTGHRIWFN